MKGDRRTVASPKLSIRGFPFSYLGPKIDFMHDFLDFLSPYLRTN